MGAVYRALDTRLDRHVAVKILSPEVAGNPSLNARFAAEAKAISALNHPHICTLHDVGHQDGIDYLVMELCEGTTLQDRIAEGPLPIDELLNHGIEIAEALDQAHRQGIVHRDLKPANIMVTTAGIKILDFGLAKRLAEGSADEPPDRTVRRPLTEARQIVGTLQYMSPEQLTGMEADARSDIFAFGLILYEMIVGKPPFEADSRATLMAAILERRPPSIGSERPGTPELLVRIVDACLVKNPDDRIQTAQDLKLDLSWAAATPPTPSAATPARHARVLPMIIAAVVVTWAATFVALRPQRVRTAEAPQVTRSTIDLRGAPQLALAGSAPRIGFFSPVLALSHDGRTIVYVGLAGDQTQLFLRRLDAYQIEPIPGTSGARHAFFSPDDEWLGFLTDDNVMKIPLSGGSPVRLAEANSPLSAVWTERGEIVVGVQNYIMRIPDRGGTPQVFPLAEFADFKDVLPDGRSVLLSRRDRLSGDFSGVTILDLDSGSMTPLLDAGYDARYVPTGFLTFVTGGDIQAVAFDLNRKQVIGTPVTVQTRIATESFFRQSQYAVSNAGALAFIPGSDRSSGTLTFVDHAGNTEAVEHPSGLYGIFDLSPDGRRIVIEVSDVNEHFVNFDLSRNEGRRVLTPPGECLAPSWTADSAGLIIPCAERAGQPSRILRIDPERMSSAVVYSGSDYIRHARLSPDGSLLALTKRGSQGGLKRLGDASPVRWPKGMGWSPAFSPDGRWIAHTSNQTGKWEVWISSTADPESSFQISTGGGLEPVWCDRCPDLFYRNGAQWYSVRMSTEDQVGWDVPRPVWHTEFIDSPGRSYDVSPDGERLLISKPGGVNIVDRIDLVANWSSLVPRE